MEQHEPKGNPPASKTEIEKLKVKKISKEDIENKLSCPICTEDFKEEEEDGDVVVSMPCDHCFHKKNCLIPWLERVLNFFFLMKEK
jgi:hypothetical protein